MIHLIIATTGPTFTYVCIYIYINMYVIIYFLFFGGELSLVSWTTCGASGVPIDHLKSWPFSPSHSGPETNIAPENGWLEYDHSLLEWLIFTGELLGFREGKTFIHSWFLGVSDKLKVTKNYFYPEETNHGQNTLKSNEQPLLFRVYIGDYTTQFYGGYDKPMPI